MIPTLTLFAARRNTKIWLCLIRVNTSSELLLGAEDTSEASGELLLGADDPDKTDDELVLNAKDAD